MRKITLSLSLLAAMLVLVFTLGPSNAALAQDNLLQNPGFEGPYSAWQIQYGTAQVAPNWTPWWVEDGDADPVLAQPEYKPAEKRHFPDRVFEGDYAQQWFTFHKSHVGGMYQQVTGVTPGQTYRFSLVAQVWSTNGDTSKSVGAGDPRFRVGIDPTGFAQPGHVSGPPSSVEWSPLAPMSGILDNWQGMAVEVTAQSDVITVYMMANPQYAVKHNDIYVDAAQLVAVGTPVAVTPPTTNTGGGTSGSGDCVIPTSGPWPACARGGWNAGSTNSGNTNTGGTSTGTGGCQIPTVGPWPECARNPWSAGGAAANANNNANQGGGTDIGNGCVIPKTGPWPACARNGGTRTTTAPTTPTTPTAPTTPTTPTTPPASNVSGFALGGQTHTFANVDLMRSAGMNWVKFQHKWSEGDTPGVVSGRIQQAHDAGFKVLLSIPGSDHNNINYSAYVDFLGGVASLGPDAIEVWNEMNIDREWPSGQISGSAYVNNMLKPAYQKIKASNSNVMVISGAPAPTGFFGGCGPAGCDDAPYIEQMANAGAASYMDCLGIHYNEGIISPTQSSGDPRGNGGHYTRYYSGMVNAYKAAIKNARPLCFTELGYLSGDGYPAVPAGFSWAKDTTVAQQAQWLGEATALAKADPAVAMLIIFNIDFTLYETNGDPQAGFAMLRPGGGCPACSTVKAASGN